MQVVYWFCYMSAVSGFWWPNCEASLVLLTVPDYPPSVRVVTGTESTVQVSNCQGTRPAGSCQRCYPDRTFNIGFLTRLEPDLGSNYTVPTGLAPIKYSSSDRIMTWWIRIWCSFSRSFTSCIPICNPTDIRWVVEKWGQIWPENCGFSIATQWILVGSQIWKWEVKEGPEMNNLDVDHGMIRWKLKYLIGAVVVKLKSQVISRKTGPIAMVRVFVW